ncbi:hypothetical protein AXF42_Ash000598 [Apostasia shenzhenica]|uniref:Uncharacterized protein n=1 Tax=Apostasia shenzhenica TaxID=1088818 RepID=A0A2I0AGT0_9ASPA|nr:hypothetical protein AXF42_Ash000598 [Apostasia shenzhenica]
MDRVLNYLKDGTQPDNRQAAKKQSLNAPNTSSSTESSTEGLTPDPSLKMSETRRGTRSHESYSRRGMWNSRPWPKFDHANPASGILLARYPQRCSVIRGEVPLVPILRRYAKIACRLSQAYQFVMALRCLGAGLSEFDAYRYEKIQVDSGCS